ncbi:endonuclease domain-containing protein [Dermacoccus nishinomiyaensis]|uniref:endonuclease domain-containing protein n=1 Tax=Dermacoccus nishinomiyaensis TaxID=1274 RepID=UPI0021A44DEA|nr:endonuclease domain-containing protein [Dermacoccus nishinomiyaensis]MCT1603560.1 endonuclease domain-containing protein [Dermacoccus nishinomiyaensis]
MVAQRRMARPEAMMHALRLLPKLKRRVLIGEVLGDVSEGSQSLGELDFAAMRRRHGLLKPDRQVLREGSDGRMYLDCSWSWAKLVVEIDGAQHHVGDSPWRDALRQNTLTLQGDRVLRIPLLALRVAPEPFFAQLEPALAGAAADLAS